MTCWTYSGYDEIFLAESVNSARAQSCYELRQGQFQQLSVADIDRFGSGFKPLGPTR